MKITTEKLMVWTKRAVLTLALAAAGVMLPSCEKESKNDIPVYRAPYEKELRFKDFEVDSIQPNIIKPFAYDTACKHIYLTVKDNNNFTNYNSDDIKTLRNYLNERIELAPDKISGRGDFRFMPNTANFADSLWFIQHGWTIRQKQH